MLKTFFRKFINYSSLSGHKRTQAVFLLVQDAGRLQKSVDSGGTRSGIGTFGFPLPTEPNLILIAQYWTNYIILRWVQSRQTQATGECTIQQRDINCYKNMCITQYYASTLNINKHTTQLLSNTKEIQKIKETPALEMEFNWETVYRLWLDCTPVH